LVAFPLGAHCTAPAKVRILLLLETGSKPQEKRLILPVFPFAGFETPPWPTLIIVPLVKRKGDESVSRLRSRWPRAGTKPPSNAYAFGRLVDSLYHAFRGMP
jgi:hypothetical protein